MKAILPLFLAALGLSACEIDTSALQDIQDTAARAEATAQAVNARSAQVQQAVDDPAGALRAAVGATFVRTATDQPGVHVLTDVQTGCQFLATYGSDGRTVSSIAPRNEAAPGGGLRQRCVAESSGSRSADAEAEAEG